MATMLIWLSRHELTIDQKNDLPPADGGSMEVRASNMTYPAYGVEAAIAIGDVAFAALNDAQHTINEVVISGVFPAHVAAALLNDRPDFGPDVVVKIAFPVSVPVFAKEGEPRGFAHSHWEIY